MNQTDFHAKINECLVKGLEFKVNFYESELMIPAHIDITTYDWDKSEYWIHSFSRGQLKRMSSIGGGLTKWDLNILSPEFPKAKDSIKPSKFSQWFNKWFVKTKE